MEKHADVAPDGNSLLSATQVRALRGCDARRRATDAAAAQPLVVRFETAAPDGKTVSFTTHMTPSEVEAC